MARSAPEGLPQACHTARTAIWAIKPPYTLNTRPKSPLNTPTNPPKPHTNHRQKRQKSISHCVVAMARSAPEGLSTGLSHGQDRDFGDKTSLHTQNPTQITPQHTHNTPQTPHKPSGNLVKIDFSDQNVKFSKSGGSKVYGVIGGPNFFLKNRNFLLHFWTIRTIQTSEIPKMA